MQKKFFKKSLSVFMALLMLLAVPFGALGTGDVVGVQACAIESEQSEASIEVSEFNLESILDCLSECISLMFEKVFYVLTKILEFFGMDSSITDQDFDITLEEMYYYSTDEYILSLYDNYNMVLTYNLEDPYYDTYYIDSDYFIVSYDEANNFTVMYDRVNNSYYYCLDGEYRTLAGDVENTYSYFFTDSYVMGISDTEYLISTEISDDKILVVSQIDDQEIINEVASGYYYETSEDIVSLKFEYELNSETYVIEKMIAYGVYADGTEYMYNILEVTYDSIYTSSIHADIMEEFSSVSEYRTITIIISSGTEDEFTFETQVADNYLVGIYLPENCYSGLFTDPECTESTGNNSTTGDVTYYSYFVS
ncbi:MAG: hypothetical protein R3Y27_04095 [Clostridia bacterium]